MRIEIIEDIKDAVAVPIFPPDKGFVDLRQNPHAVELIAAARQYLPLRNFLIALNSPESIFATATAATHCGSSTASFDPGIHEFGSCTLLVFAAPSLNFDPGNITELAVGLKELLERETGDSIEGMLWISSCDFPAQNRRGFCLRVRLVARGDSAKQAELRWGLGLARVQQALLFRGRALGQQIGT